MKVLGGAKTGKLSQISPNIFWKLSEINFFRFDFYQIKDYLIIKIYKIWFWITINVSKLAFEWLERNQLRKTPKIQKE